MNDSSRSKRRTHKGALTGIREVARAAGVSTATVSRVFSSPDTVRQQTRERVLEAAKQLKYIPDGAARALGSRVRRRIGVLIPTIKDSVFANFIGALQQRLSREGYTLLVGVYDFDVEYEAKELRGLLESGVDGIVLCGAARPDEQYELLRRRNTPFVNANIYAPECTHPSIGPDFRAASAKVVQYLLDLGHRRIGYLDLPARSNDRAAQRLAGIIDALQTVDLELPEEQYVERPLSIEDGRIGLRTLFEQVPELTALYCGNDVLAIGALFEAKDIGISVPEEMSIVGFDNLELSAQLSPSLTTVNIPSTEMGERVAERLLLTLAGKATPHATRIETNLIVRGSTGPVRIENPDDGGGMARDVNSC